MPEKGLLGWALNRDNCLEILLSLSHKTIATSHHKELQANSFAYHTHTHSQTLTHTHIHSQTPTPHTHTHTARHTPTHTPHTHSQTLTSSQSKWLRGSKTRIQRSRERKLTVLSKSTHTNNQHCQLLHANQDEYSSELYQNISRMASTAQVLLFIIACSC